MVNVGPKSSTTVAEVEGREVDRMLIVGVVLGGSMLVVAGLVLGALVCVYRRRDGAVKRGTEGREGVELRVLGTTRAGEEVVHIP